MELKAEVRRLAEECLASESQFIVELVVSDSKGTGKVLVIVDGDNGIGIDDCALISQKLSKTMDERDLLESKYMLEVSTPGLDQPLKLERQYRKNIGRGLKVILEDRTAEGILKQVSEKGIVLTQEEGKGKNKQTIEEEILFSAIKKATVKISFK